VLFALPVATWLGAAGAELRRGSWSLQLGALAGAASEVALARGSARVMMAGAEVFGCRGWSFADLGTQLCLGAFGTALRATGYRFDANETATSAWAAGGVGAGLRWPRDAKLSLRVALRGYYNVLRPQLQVEVEGAREQVSLASLGGAARLELIFAAP
jgi:hypothetical protein